MAGTILVAVRKALIAALADLEEMEGVHARYSWDLGATARERLYTRRGRISHAPASLRTPPVHRKETGRFDLVLFVEGPGRDLEWVAERAAELGRVCEDWIAARSSAQLGVAGLQTLLVDGEGDLVEAFTDAPSPVAELAYPITYTARLT